MFTDLNKEAQGLTQAEEKALLKAFPGRARDAQGVF